MTIRLRPPLVPLIGPTKSRLAARRREVLAGIAVTAMTLGLPGAARAATLVVTSTADSGAGSLRTPSPPPRAATPSCFRSAVPSRS
ncbi:hypothetical protein [Bradyrhizobium betae]|uniref:hypothetical protein n=1 Tax=Bradyrhizobium betae TaxID=244734 RepID=UPI001FCE6C9E|nr:hypothetical protein [Bradyrhizobium betae]MCS3728354.1 hypothetical protein [Bradyrhizobium betae]